MVIFFISPSREKINWQATDLHSCVLYWLPVEILFSAHILLQQTQQMICKTKIAMATYKLNVFLVNYCMSITYLDSSWRSRVPAGCSCSGNAWPCGHCQDLGWILQSPILPLQPKVLAHQSGFPCICWPSQADRSRTATCWDFKRVQDLNSINFTLIADQYLL